MGRVWVALVLILVLATGCSLFSKKKAPSATNPQPPAGQQQPKQSPPEQTGQPTVPQRQNATPESVQQVLRRGSTSADGRFVVAAVTTGDPEVVGVWVAGADLTGAKRLTKELQQYAGPPRWTPWNTVLFAVENGLNQNVTWFEADPSTGSLQEFLPSLLKGSRALIGPDAFSADGKQLVYSTGNCLCPTPTARDQVEVYLVNTDGTGKRLLGNNVMAGFPGGRLVVAPLGK